MNVDEILRNEIGAIGEIANFEFKKTKKPLS